MTDNFVGSIGQWLWITSLMTVLELVVTIAGYFIFYWNQRIETLSELIWTLKYSLKYEIELIQFYPNSHVKLYIRIQINIQFET